MNGTSAEAIARAVLYEGFLLYPYRSSALKNQKRPMFGTLEPGGQEELGGDCIVEGSRGTSVAATLRFLQDLPSGALEREVPVEASLETLARGGLIRDFDWPPAAGRLTLSAEALGSDRWKLSVRIERRGGEALISCHVLLGAPGGRILSDPQAGALRGLWPVLLGTPPDRSLALWSPIILPDYPEVAPESPRDLFDLTEIDEILSLRILTLSDAEKDEIRRQGGRARDLLARTEGLSPEALLALHGRAARRFQAGDRVRLRPKGRADILDLALEGREATVLSVEEDLEGRGYVAVTVADDPGSDLGAAGFLGHRFFFRPEEVELL